MSSEESSVPPQKEQEGTGTPPVLPIPLLDVRWVHVGAQHLDLPIAPITSATTAYKAFSAEESQRIEERWVTVPISDRERIVNEWGKEDGEWSQKKKAQDKDKDKDQHVQDDSNSDQRASDLATAKLDGGLPDTEVIHSGQEQIRQDRLGSRDSTYRKIVEKAHGEYVEVDVVKGVPVSQDSLFEVDLDTLSLHPVFWAHTGPRVPVLRGTWFVGDETRPCNWELAREIEKGYEEIKPWQPWYKAELATAMALGPAAEEKLKYQLPARFGHGLGVVFENENQGRLITTGALTYLSRALWSSLRTKPGGTYIYRGFSAALGAKESITPVKNSRSQSHSHSRRDSLSSQPGQGDKDACNTEITAGSIVKAATETPNKATDALLGVKDKLKQVKEVRDKLPDKWHRDRKALEEENAPVTDSNEDDAPCTDLILVIHGIGQQLATQYESYNFVYAGNQLRQIIRKQSADPALASIIRDRRCQVLPVQWRASLNLEHTKTEEDFAHSMDNRFTMADITMNKSIPYVRELTNSVLFDIPLFMSHHRQKMIEAVCMQANKLYRLWIARHPEFEQKGRVHIIGHSLGSALAAHILSNQPTSVPPLSGFPKMVLNETRDRFLFNTSNLFLVGSPLGVFLHLDQAQLMPRKGRERTMHSPQDEAFERAGKFGCMAIDSLYNIFYYTDPIAYALNATVDVRLAANRPPLAITSVTAPFFSSVSESLGSISKYLPSYFGGGASTEKKGTRPSVIRLPSGIEMKGPSGEERLEGSRGERRFSALNPHGNVDFFLPSGGVSDYLDMITAHANYWSDPSFAAFLLAEIYSTPMDLIRTGMGLASQEEFTQGTDI